MKHEAGEPRKWRIFCAVELPDEVKSAIQEHVSHLRQVEPEASARWERPEKLHLTMKFLGEIEVGRVAALESAATRAARLVASFSLTVKGTGAFPPRGQPRVLWLGVEDAGGQLFRLQRELEDACAVEGFTRETRDFHPHLTIARLRPPVGARERALTDAHRQMDFAVAPFRVEQLFVVRSELGSGGSRYTTLSSHPLSSPTADSAVSTEPSGS